MPRIVSPLVPAAWTKWLNIVFDLNGVLCHSAMKLYGEKMNPYQVEDNVLCHRRPTIVGPKAVFARPNVGEFLREVSEIAHRVVVWTTILKHNAEGITGHLFNGCRPPYNILSQEQCTKIEVSRGKFFHLNVQMHCLKDLNDVLFHNPSGDTSFTPNNTILIDDSPNKSVCNENGNAIFPVSWSRTSQRDDGLLGEILPWLRRLHSQCQTGQLRQYVNDNRIGINPLNADDYDMRRIVEGMIESAHVMGFKYELRGIGLVVEPTRRSRRESRS